MTAFPRLRRLGAPIASAIVTAAVFTGALWVQHAREAWPFAPGRQAVAPQAHSEMPSAAGPASTHDRVPVDVNPATVQELGIRVEVVGREALTQEVRAVATVVPDESRISHVHTRVPGWVEQLDVNTTGEMVTAGQPLARIFSQELLSSQTEYLAARRTTAASGIASAVITSGRTRLTVLGMTPAEIDGIEQAGEPRRLVTVVAPRSGVVVNRGITVGTSVDPSTTLMTIADLSRVWVLAEVPEANIPGIRVGTTAQLDFPASGRQPFAARVDFLYPTLTDRTRTLRVRFSAANPTGALRPGLYGTAAFESTGQRVITVPRDAVVDTGVQQHVFVATGDRFEPRAVTLGVQLADRVEIRSGLAEGERIVAAGVFLLDSESRLRATGGAGGHRHGAPTTPKDTPSAPAKDPHAGHEKTSAAPAIDSHAGHRPASTNAGGQGVTAMVEKIIELSVRHKWVVFGVVLMLALFAANSARQTPLDALPDISDPQVIIFTEWMGRSPDLVEDQITYPLVRALQSTPGVRTVRGYSMFGMSFTYALFDEGTDIYWARTRVLEQLGRVQQLLPPGVSPTLGPDASGVGWVYQYVLKDSSGRMDLAELRALQDFTVRPALQAVAGVAEVASLGGFERQYQIVIDPDKLVGFGLTVTDITRSVRDANAEVGARVLELAGREYVLRGRGYVKALKDLEQSVVTVGPGGTPIRLGDVARVGFGPEIRRGAADWNGTGEAVGGIVVMRIGSNALQVIRALEAEIATLRLPDGVRLIPTYDRSELILGSVETLTDTLIQQAIIVTIICLVFLFHARSALVVMIVLPLSVLMSFIGIRYLGLSSNIMSLGGIAIAIGELGDAVIVLIENAHVRLASAPPGSDRQRIIVDACKEVGRPIFFSLLLITISFLPIFTLAGQAGRLFMPLAYTKTFAMFAAAMLSITLAPPLMVLLLKGRFRTEATNPVSRLLSAVYRPIAVLVVRFRILVVAAAVVLMAATVPTFQRLGSEFMPPLDEGSLLVMPTTFPGIAIEEARRALTAQDRIIMRFPEIASVHGKAGRAETATDPAQLDMIESVIALRPRAAWPTRYTPRWYSTTASDWAKRGLRRVWPEQRARTLAELSRDLDVALRMPGYQMAIAPPIRTRIDMLTTGVRTPVGIKVFGEDLTEIERISIALEGMLRQVPGTRSTFAERQTGREYVDIVPNREAIARYGLTVRDVQDVVEAAVGGMPVSTAIAGRARFSINLRYAADQRSDPQALRRILVPVQATGSAADPGGGNAGAGTSGQAGGSVASSAGGTGGGMGSMGGGGQSGASGGTSASLAAPPMGGFSASPDVMEQWRQPGAAVPLGQLADVRVTTGPPMIKDENGVLVGYVFADIDQTQRDLGGWVSDAKAVVASQLTLPAGYRLQWTGQYEFLAAMEARLRYVIPLTLILVVALLYLSMRGWPQTFLVLSSLPFALAGSVWLLAFMHYNLSTAVWVGLIAVAGVAAETGIVMVVYLDEAFARYSAEGRIQTPEDVDAAVVEGASARVRPLVMTVATTVLGLMPLLWEGGVGADVSARTAAPVVGGLWSCMLLTLLVLPAAYAMWRRHQVRAANRAALPHDAAGASEGLA